MSRSDPAGSPRRVGTGPGRPGRPARITRCRSTRLRRAGLVQRDQHLAQLDPPIGLDHDGLAALERTAAVRRRPEPPHITHHAIADQVRRIAHRPAPPLVPHRDRDSLPPGSYQIRTGGPAQDLLARWSGRLRSRWRRDDGIRGIAGGEDPCSSRRESIRAVAQNLPSSMEFNAIHLIGSIESLKNLTDPSPMSTLTPPGCWLRGPAKAFPWPLNPVHGMLRSEMQRVGWGKWSPPEGSGDRSPIDRWGEPAHERAGTRHAHPDRPADIVEESWRISAKKTVLLMPSVTMETVRVEWPNGDVR